MQKHQEYLQGKLNQSDSIEFMHYKYEGTPIPQKPVENKQMGFMTRHQEFMQRNSYPYSYQGEVGDQTDLRKRGTVGSEMDLNFDAVADKPFIPGMGKLDFGVLFQGRDT